jgi:3-hydroxy-9,10-secoandrosta-1,3,5(10)-triene-9,17-dione monooxygenase
MAQTSLEHCVQLTIDANASSPENMSHELRAILKLDCMSVCRMAWESVQTGLSGSGSSIFKKTDPTQRVVRDLQVLLSHMTIDEDGFLSRAGEILLGRSTDTDPTKDFL